MRFIDVPRALAVGLVLAFVSPGQPLSAQGKARLQPTCIQNVGLPTCDAPDARATLVLRGGRITQVLGADAPAPPGTRIVDGSDLIALPAFLDAYTQKCLETPTPIKDQDRPLDEGSDVRVDMRQANRKGIQPAFRAVDALALTADDAEAWQQSGFGAALVSPSGQLLAGTSVLATARDAAARDIVLAPEVFAHGAFAASGGGGYPSTLMGYIAQLRQFFFDARWHDELERRYSEDRPGERPPFDASLTSARALLRGDQVLACEAESARDIERWLKLSDQFGLSVAVVGGNDAARLADVLAARDIPVVLTLDWGKEVDDPHAEDEEAEESSEEDSAEEQEPDAGDDPGDDIGQGEVEEVEEPALAEPDTEGQEEESGEANEPSEEAEEEPNWIYEAPLAVREEQRRLWEERRDVTLRLAEHDVRFAFGSADETPKKLLGKVRTLVEIGLPREAALGALTTEAARLLGVERKLGRIAPGFDATLSLWTADPLTDEDAQVAWSFVDGYRTEFEVKEKDPAAEGEAQDAAGTWSLETEMMGETRESTLVLIQDDDGGLTGTLSYESMSGDKETSSVTGMVRGSTFDVTGSMSFGDESGELTLSGTFEGDSFEGSATYNLPYMDEAFEAEVTGTRTPEVLLELERHAFSCHETHAVGGLIR